MISSEDCREKRVRQGNYCLVKQEGKEDVNSFDNTATTTYALQTGADTGMTILLFLIAATDLISQPWNLSVSWRRGIWEAASKMKGEGNKWVSETCAFWKGDTHRKSNAQSGKCTHCKKYLGVLPRFTKKKGALSLPVHTLAVSFGNVLVAFGSVW